MEASVAKRIRLNRSARTSQPVCCNRLSVPSVTRYYRVLAPTFKADARTRVPPPSQDFHHAALQGRAACVRVRTEGRASARPRPDAARFKRHVIPSAKGIRLPKLKVTSAGFLDSAALRSG